MSETQGPSPIFIVGSYRSGTSIFCWCLGQHPNIVNLPETNWLARAAVDANNLYRLATINGEYSHLGRIGISEDEFYRLIGEGIEHVIQETNVKLLRSAPTQADSWIPRRHSLQETKHRWVDATPENSHYVYGLSKLFPNAKFIHLLRNPHEVARSLTRFSRAGARDFEPDEAYKAWLRLTEAAYNAERSLRPERIMRVHFDELTAAPDRIFHEVLEFVGEPFSEACKYPLKQRINSSKVEAEAFPRPSPFSEDAEALYEKIRNDGVVFDPDAYGKLQEIFSRYCDNQVSLTEEVASLRTRVEELHSEVVRQDQELRDLRDQRDDLKRELDRVHASASWRLTSPIRQFRSFLLRI